jgi:hypothetical protein
MGNITITASVDAGYLFIVKRAVIDKHNPGSNMQDGKMIWIQTPQASVLHSDLHPFHHIMDEVSREQLSQ